MVLATSALTALSSLTSVTAFATELAPCFPAISSAQSLPSAMSAIIRREHCAARRAVNYQLGPCGVDPMRIVPAYALGAAVEQRDAAVETSHGYAFPFNR